MFKEKYIKPLHIKLKFIIKNIVEGFSSKPSTSTKPSRERLSRRSVKQLKNLIKVLNQIEIKKQAPKFYVISKENKSLINKIKQTDHLNFYNSYGHDYSLIEKKGEENILTIFIKFLMRAIILLYMIIILRVKF